MLTTKPCTLAEPEIPHVIHVQTESHAFDLCPHCGGCYWCGVPEDEHEGVA